MATPNIVLQSTIYAPKERVWDILWTDATYRQWTLPFCEGSYAESDWKEGSPIRFLGSNNCGMFGIIQKKVDFEVMIFKHLGEIKDGVEVPKDWSGREAWFLEEENGVTQVRLELDVGVPEFAEFISTTYPQCLELVKQLAEANKKSKSLRSVGTTKATAKVSLQFSINAVKDKVWDTLWSDHSYRKWAAVFSPGTYAEGDWSEGSRIRILTTSKNGMYGVIEKKVPSEVMIVKHLGCIKDGVDVSPEEGGESPTEGSESYFLEEQDGSTSLRLEIQTLPEHEEFMRTSFQKAMEVVKQLSEAPIVFQKVQCQININAPKEKVWEILWNDETYRKWTAPFCEGSYAVSDWNEGDPVQFLSPGGSGMFGIIKKKVVNETMIFQQLGEVHNGKEIPKYWAGDNSLEAYFLEETDGVTVLKTEVDTLPSFLDYMNLTFPKSLEVVKQLAEA